MGQIGLADDLSLFLSVVGILHRVHARGIAYGHRLGRGKGAVVAGAVFLDHGAGLVVA